MLFDISMPHAKFVQMLDKRTQILKKISDLWTAKSYEKCFTIIEQ